MPPISPFEDICCERPPVVRDPLRTSSPIITETPEDTNCKSSFRSGGGGCIPNMVFNESLPINWRPLNASLVPKKKKKKSLKITKWNSVTGKVRLGFGHCARSNGIIFIGVGLFKSPITTAHLDNWNLFFAHFKRISFPPPSSLAFTLLIKH